MLRDRPSSAPGPVPQTHDVELPVASEAFARSEVAATDTDTDTDVDTDADSGVAAPAGVFTETFAAPDATSEADVAATDDAPFVAGDTDSETDLDTGAPSQSVTDFFGTPEATHEVAAEVGPATREVDMTALFDADAPEAEAYVPPGSYQTLESQYAAEMPEAPVASDTPFGTEAETEADADIDDELPRTDNSFDMLRPDALDSEVLDDDAFFATLREAVHDESPLGPREGEGNENDFYGDEGEKASFRDVFRRRR